MQARHIAVFIRSLAGGGGAERAMVQLARGFAEQGHRVDLILGRAEGNFVSEVPDSVRLIDLGVRRAASGLSAIARDPKSLLMLAPTLAPALASNGPPWVLGSIPQLIDYLRQERPDALVSALNYTNISALLAVKLSGVTTRTLVLEQNTVSVRAANSPQWRWRALPRLIRHFYPWADEIAAVSDGVRDDLERISNITSPPIRTVYNPVFCQAIGERASEPLEHPFFAEGAPPVILGVGKLKPQKDFPNLLEAFALLRAQRPARLVILGDGPHLKRLLALAERLGVREDVDFPGFVANPFAYMSRASVFALSSAWEGLPGALIEAMACGCTVVSCDCPSGPDEILDRGRYGRLVPTGDPAGMAKALDAALDDPGDPERMRERAKLFSIGRAADHHLRLLFPDSAAGVDEAATAATP